MKKTLLLFSMILLMVSTCLGEKTNSLRSQIQGKWYTDFTEQVGAGMNTLLALDFSENSMAIRIEFPDVVYVDVFGTYSLSDKTITPVFGNDNPDIGMCSGLVSMFRSMGADDSMIQQIRQMLVSQFQAGGGVNPFKDSGTITVKEVSDSKLVLEDEEPVILTFTRKKPPVKSALPRFKSELGL